MKYIHYGSKKFEIKKFDEIKNIPELPKADGGFWGCRIDAEYNWKNWCLENDFETNFDEFIIFELKSDAKILTIDNSEQLNELPKVKSILPKSMFVLIDFEELSKQYDAVEVLISKDHQLYWDLYGWDCDSIFVMNPDVIKEVEE